MQFLYYRKIVYFIFDSTGKISQFPKKKSLVRDEIGTMFWIENTSHVAL